MVSDGNQLVGDVLHQFFFYTERGGAGITYQSDAVTHAEDVSVYRHGSFVEHDGLNDIGRFAPYTG